MTTATAAQNAYLDSVPGLRAALDTDHDIVADIRSRFLGSRYDSLTPRQEALVLKLAKEAAKPKTPKVDAPIESGRQTVEGRVISVKWKPNRCGGYYAPAYVAKLTVAVSTPEGEWLAWGTCPAALMDAVGGEQYDERLKGATVRFDAKLKRGRDAYFALYSRPTKAVLVSVTDEVAAEMAEEEAEAA